MKQILVVLCRSEYAFAGKEGYTLRSEVEKAIANDAEVTFARYYNDALDLLGVTQEREKTPSMNNLEKKDFDMVISQAHHEAWVPTRDEEIPFIDIQANSGLALAIHCQRVGVPFVMLKHGRGDLIADDRILQEAIGCKDHTLEEVFEKLLGE